MKKNYSTNVVLILLTIIFLVAIGAVAYFVFKEEKLAIAEAPKEAKKEEPKKETEKYVEDQGKKKKTALDRIDEEPKNTDATKPAEIIKGKKERPSPVLEKDEYYLAEYNNAKPVRVPPSKLTAKEPEIKLLYQFAGSVSGIPAIKNDVLYFGCTDYQGYALTISTGEITQKQKLFSQAIGSTVIYNDYYIIPQRNGSVQCFDSRTGGNAWNHRSAVHVRKDEIDISISGVRLNGESLWVSKHWGNLYIVDANTGVLSSDPGVHYESRINILAVPFGDKVVYPNVAGEMICYSKDGIKEQWQHTIDKGYMLSLYSDNKFLYYNSTEKEFVCFDPITKKAKWKQSIEGYGYSTISEKDGNLYLAAKDIYAVSKETGEIIWTCKATTPNGYNRPIDISDDAIYAATEEGLVSKLSKKDGSILKSYDLKETIKNGVLQHKGIVYVSTTAKKLYGISFSD